MISTLPKPIASLPYDLNGKRVWIAGHRGMVGSALVRRLRNESCELLTVNRADLDLTQLAAVQAWLAGARPQVVAVAAAKVGGILANDTYPADFLRDNLLIEAGIIHAAFLAGVEKLLFLGSSCIYPRLAPQPIEESALLTGPLEPTNEWYAVAKIAGIKLCQAYRKQHGCDFISAMPTNLYGPGDNFELSTSHVIPALMRKAHEAKRGETSQLVVWGSGTPRREFLHVDDCADALVHILKRYSMPEHINVGCGEDYTISELAALVARTAGFNGEIAYDRTKPDGTPRKLLSIEKLKALGWSPKVRLAEGLAQTYRWFCDHEVKAAG